MKKNFKETIKDAGKKTWNFVYDNRGKICAVAGWVAATFVINLIKESERKEIEKITSNDPFCRDYANMFKQGVTNSNFAHIFYKSIDSKEDDKVYKLSNFGEVGNDVAKYYADSYDFDFDDDEVSRKLLDSDVSAGMLFIDYDDIIMENLCPRKIDD